MTYEPYVDTWGDHDARYERTPAAVDRSVLKSGVALSPIERAAVISFVGHVGDLVAETETAEQLSEGLAELVVESGPVFARFLATFNMEYVLMASHWLPDEGDHVTADGVIGSAVAEASARLDPMLRKREPKWYTGMTER
ncbi:MAG: hypothetical protein V3S26_02050 [Acidimicrobiia bacterium]